ncbi:tetratricopeptide repeat protein [Floridanema evergladense]|uniref:Tetratricopeptide repeat protein n=1 Tax=Floridaenema evergladense BLCC-F167 TaxID=3153639 RepID=A0ABV4WID3_9CYAN
MSEKNKSIHLLLITVLCFGFAAFGCSSQSKSTNVTTSGQPSSTTTTAATTTATPAATPVAPSDVPAVVGTPSIAQSSPGTVTDSSSLETVPNLNLPIDIDPSTTTTDAKPADGSAADFYQKGLASAKREDFKSAEELWRKSIELDPKNFAVHSNLGELLQRQGKLDEATSQYREALRLKSDDVETVMKLAVALGQQKKFDESIAQSQTAIRLKPDLAPAHIVLAAGLSGQGKDNEAIESLKKAQSLWKKQGRTEQVAAVQLQMASLLGKQGNFAEASTQLKQAIALKPDFAPAYILSAQIAMRQGKPEETVSNLQKAKDLFKKQQQVNQSAAVQWELAMLLARQKQYDRASAQAKELLATKPDFAPAYMLVSEVALRQGKPEAAVTNLQKAKDLWKKQQQNDQLAATQIQLAAVLGQQKKYDRANAEAKEVLQLKPDFAPAYLLISEVALQEGKPEEAVTNLQKAKDLLKKQQQIDQLAATQMRLAAIFGQQKKYNEASAEARELLQSKPNFAPAYLILGEVAKQQNNNSEAIANWQKAKELLTTQGRNEDAQRIDSMIQQLNTKQ